MSKKFLKTLLVFSALFCVLLFAACQKKSPPAEFPDLTVVKEPTLSFTLLEDDTYSVSKGTLGGAIEIEVPAVYNGKPVTAIAASGFSGAVLSKITLPDTIKTIGQNAFSGCMNLDDITLPSSVRVIEAGAFKECISLISFTVPEGVTSLGSQVFYNCRNLESISLPCTLQTVGTGAFDVIGEDTRTDPHKLSYYELDGDLYLGNAENKRLLLVKMGNSLNTSYTVHSDTHIIYNYAFEYSDLTSLTLHDKVTQIGAYALRSCKSLTSIHIPDSVVAVSEGAFYYCTALESITGMNGILSIGSDAFYNCRKLATLHLGTTLQEIGSYALYNTPRLQLTVRDDLCYIGNAENPYLVLVRPNVKTLDTYQISENTKIIYQSAFSGCTNLLTLTVPNGVHTIGAYAFRNCTKLKDLSLPTSLTTLDEYVFYGCKAFTELTIPKSVTKIGDAILSGCTSLATLSLPFVGQYGNGKGVLVFGYVFGASDYASQRSRIPKTLKSVIITGGKTIGHAAFANCTTIQNLTLPNTLKVMETSTFYCADSIKNIYIDDLVNWCDIQFATSESNPLSLGCSLYVNGKKLENLVIPDAVTSIRPYAFFGYTGITSLTVGDATTEIGTEAFKNCSGLATVTLGSGVKAIGTAAFEDCKALTDIKLSEGLEVIGDSALRRCVLLEKITLSASLKRIGKGAFKDCDALKGVTFKEKSDWFTADNPHLAYGESIHVWFKKKNAANLSTDMTDLYWFRYEQ